MSKILNTAVVGTLLAVAAVAHAADTTTFEVKIVITESCDISAPSGTVVDFGTADRSATPDPASAALTVNCTTGTPYSVSLNGGLFADTDGTRRMTLGTNAIKYSLYKTGNTGQPWDASSPRTGTGSGTAQSLPVHGRVAAGSTNVPAGTYVDTVTATITY